MVALGLLPVTFAPRARPTITGLSADNSAGPTNNYGVVGHLPYFAPTSIQILYYRAQQTSDKQVICSDGPSSEDELPIMDIIKQQYTKLTATQFIALQKGVRTLHELTGGSFRVGTACSGTDVVMRCLNLLFGRWRQLFGVQFRPVHCFSCENKDFKQRFLDKHWQAPIFADLEDLVNESADTTAGKLLMIPLVHLLVVGIGAYANPVLPPLGRRMRCDGQLRGSCV